MSLIHILFFNHYLMIHQIIYSSQIFLNLQSWIQLGISLLMFCKHLNSHPPRPAPPLADPLPLAAPSSTQLAKLVFCESSLTSDFFSSAFPNHLLTSSEKRLLVLASLSFIVAAVLIYFWTSEVLKFLTHTYQPNGSWPHADMTCERTRVEGSKLLLWAIVTCMDTRSPAVMTSECFSFWGVTEVLGGRVTRHAHPAILLSPLLWGVKAGKLQAHCSKGF